MSNTVDQASETLSSYWFKAALWMVPVIFGAGGIYVSVSHSSAEVKAFKTNLEKVEKEVSEHTKAGVGHEATKSRLDRIETGQIRMITRQQVQSENIAAICQATNARCK